MKKCCMVLILLLIPLYVYASTFMYNKYAITIDNDLFYIEFVNSPFGSGDLTGKALLYKNKELVESYDFVSEDNWIEVPGLTNFYYIEKNNELLLITNDKYVLEAIVNAN